MIATEKQNDTTVVRPNGKITAANAEAFREALKAIVGSGQKNITIDLAEVDIIDSKGLAVFVVCYKTLMAEKGSLTVITDNEDFRGLFRLMRLDEHFTVKSPE